MYKVAVVGASGYAGGEVIRLLQEHPNCEVVAVYGNSSAGQSLKTLHQFWGISKKSTQTKNLIVRSVKELISDVLLSQSSDAGGESTSNQPKNEPIDVVFFALPHGKSGQYISELLEKVEHPPLLIDLGADFRLKSRSAWKEYYSESPFMVEEIAKRAEFVYGLPEMQEQRELLQKINFKKSAQSEGAQTTNAHLGHEKSADRKSEIFKSYHIAVPGCNATAVTLALQPLFADQELLESIDISKLTATLAVGYSGAGKKLAPHLLASEAINNVQPYALYGSHRHIPEIKQNLRTVAQKCSLAPDLIEQHLATLELVFTPVLVPINRGILAVVNIPLNNALLQSSTKLQQIYQQFYLKEHFVEVLETEQIPSTNNVLGTNYAQVSVGVDQKAACITVIMAIDNLVRGTAGQAIQSMNLALGLDENLGL
jgi:N-acetyl-gamma-glutamyl-phosphate reductase